MKTQRARIIVLLVVITMCVSFLPGISLAHSSPTVFFCSDDMFLNRIVSDTVLAGVLYTVRFEWYPVYDNEGYDMKLYDSNGNEIGKDSKAWTNSGRIMHVSVRWDTWGFDPGVYKVILIKKYYSNGAWVNETEPYELTIKLVTEIPKKNGLTQDNDGIWRYYENNIFVEKTGIVEYEGGQFFVANGVLCSTVNGLAEYGGQWYFLANGQIQTQYVGLALYDGEWFYVQNGLFDPNLSGLVDYDGSKFIVAAGRIIRGINGLWQNTDGVWYFLADSQVVTYYTGIVEYDGARFYVINGRLATEFTGDVEQNGVIYHVVGGQVV